MLSNRLRPVAMSLMLGCGGLPVADAAINTASIVASAISPSCISWRVSGICYWLKCTPFGCTVKTSIKVTHFIPETVVSVYQDKGKNPWTEMALVSGTSGGVENAISGALAGLSAGGGESVSKVPGQRSLHTRFKYADAIGHPATSLIGGQIPGYSCNSAATPLFPYFLSTLDTLVWRTGVPELAYPEALIPGIHRDNILPVWRALHDRIELPPAAAYAREETYWQDMLNLLVQATGHPQRLHRFGLTVDGRTDEVQEALVAELGAAFLTASLGLPDRQPSRHDVAPWVSFLHDDPWRLFRAAEAARKAMVWLSARRPAMTTVEMWQKMATLILETHYGFPLDDTTLGCRSVVERHLECGITPLMAINALARIYQWERCDQPQRSLFLNDVGADSEILTLSEMCPGLLTCYRVPASTGVPEEAERADSFPLLPTPVASEGEGAANDDGPDDPDDNVVALPWAARRGKNNPHIQRFVSLFNQTAPDANRWQVFSDFVHMAACSLYNAIHRDETFEADYRQRVARYSTEDAHNMSRLLAEVIEGLEFCPTDFLGQIFMNLELGNTRHGQYFTPYNVCYTMSRMTLSDRLSVLTSGERDFITVSDPACGAGGMIVAMAEAMLEAGFNPQKQMMVYCVDIDPVAAMMCYIQLSLMGIPAIVATGNSLTVAIKREMATPMFVLGHWHHRWQAERTRQAA
ncbi:hypothetical protein GG857_15140 [Salmonella enterica]|nr:hypothetical protein [Salmonella enterica]